jgi:pentatricopeptide repeat protein
MDDALKYINECESLNIEPNRVTYNIVMNGLRQAGKPNEIIELRKKMNQHNLEINDTTTKFTSIAYMMLGQKENAVKEFLSYPQINVITQK